ncbi:putative Glycoside hydrolase family 105 protein [Seiridium cardinale]|uniref:Glycoside hydrolase family 105 protein n=1 Tax=Seiridium cardinale TaxID=138064 RepID=A0ABR2XD35_9PEZI
MPALGFGTTLLGILGSRYLDHRQCLGSGWHDPRSGDGQEVEFVKDLKEHLKTVIQSIIDPAVAWDEAEPNEPLLRNYLSDTSLFGELSGTTLLTATIVVDIISSDGLLSRVVNPPNWNDKISAYESPEAQSFAVLMFAAYRDVQTGYVVNSLKA